MLSNLSIKVVVCIFLHDDSEPKCAFFDNGDELSLPSIKIDENIFAAEAAIKLMKKCINENLMQFDIVPCGFFDPVNKHSKEKKREIYLCYKTNITPGVSVLKDLKFMDFDSIRMAKKRIKLGYYRAYQFSANV